MGKKLKTCAQCKNQAASELLVCQRCECAFLDQADANLARSVLWLGFLTSLGMAALLGTTESAGYADVLHSSQIWAYSSGLCLIIVWPLLKLYQKIENPERKVITELLSTLNTTVIFNIMLIVGVLNIIEPVSDGSFISVDNPWISETQTSVFVDYYNYASVLLLLIFACFRKFGLSLFAGSYEVLVPKYYITYPGSRVIAKEYGGEFRFYYDNKSVVSDKVSFGVVDNISGIYLKDNFGIYYGADRILPMADPESITYIDWIEPSPGWCYAKDKHRVYVLDGLKSRPIDGSDPSTFEYLLHGYARDKNNIYRYGEPVLKPEDMDSFEQINEFIAKDSKYLYLMDEPAPHKVEMFDINKLDIRPGYLIYEGQGYSYTNGKIEEYNGLSEEGLELLKTDGFFCDETYAAELAEIRYRENAKKSIPESP